MREKKPDVRQLMGAYKRHAIKPVKPSKLVDVLIEYHMMKKLKPKKKTKKVMGVNPKRKFK